MVVLSIALFARIFLTISLLASLPCVICHLLYSICTLYNWRYKRLGNLPHVHVWHEYQVANAGFRFDFQLIDVQDFNGQGESEPNPYYYQVRSLSIVVYAY